MPSLLVPVVLESCSSSLRERRRSSINPISSIPKLFPTSQYAHHDSSAIVDDDDHSGALSSADNGHPVYVAPTLSTLTHVQLPDHASKVNIARHYHSLPNINASQASSPSSSSPPTAFDTDNTSLMLPSIGEPDHTYVKMVRLRWRLASGFFAYFMCGWGDGVTGTVLPYFMAEFHITFMMSSLLFAGSTLGFFSGTLLVESLISQLGRFDLAKSRWRWIPCTWLPFRIFPFKKGNTKHTGFSPSQARLLALVLSSCLHGMFFVMMGTKGGFWVLFFAYALAAFARAILTASLNAYFADGPKQSLGYAFGLWTLGGVASPLVCQVAIARGVPWTQFYFGSLVLSAINVTFLVLTFKPTATEFLRDYESAMAKFSGQTSSSEERFFSKEVGCGSPTSMKKRTTSQNKTLCMALKLRYQWAVTIFALLYCGCETTTQGFMVSYLLGIRNANPKTVGYVTSGFWGGITIGRFAWGHYTPKFTYKQRKFVIQGCILIGLAMQLQIWFVNSNAQNAFATSVIGVVYGPVFPACLSLANDILPSEVRLVSMAFISAGASAGAAIFPFVAGTISSAQGVRTLTYVTVPLAGTIAFLWAFFPSKKPLRPES